MTVLRFPEGFEWGTATAAFQIEGSKGGEYYWENEIVLFEVLFP